jgi:uncharacterized protein YbjT (DUF2867 family)
MTPKPLVLVTGATGAQGGSVAQHLLQSNQFRVRALTRNPKSPKAKALEAAGAELATGDLNDKDSLLRALEGTDSVFGVTNFWEHFDREYEHGINLVDAVTDSGVKQFVFSTLPSVTAITNGALPVPHFDLKARMEDYARSKKPDTTFVHMAFYYQNFFGFIPFQHEGDEQYSFGFPLGDAPMAAVSVKDVGGILLPVFQHPEQYAGKTIETAGDFLTADQYAAILSKVSGKKITYRYIPRDQYAALGFPGAEEVANMFEYYRLHQPYGEEAVRQSRSLYPALKSFEQQVSEEREALTAALEAATRPQPLTT